MEPLPKEWRAAVGGELEQPYFQRLREFVDAERASHPVYPPEGEVFTALRLTPPDAVRVVILGQDPYHGPGQAHGLAFSVRPGVRPPPSLVNVFKELRSDVGCPAPANGDLVPWAERGVLLLNAVLTVRGGEANSHKNRGWETFTDAVLRAVAARREHVVFVLWGGYAGKKAALVDTGGHTVLRSAHPSPLSVKKFVGSRPFTKANEALRAHGQPPVDWCLPEG